MWSARRPGVAYGWGQARCCRSSRSRAPMSAGYCRSAPTRRRRNLPSAPRSVPAGARLIRQLLAEKRQPLVRRQRRRCGVGLWAGAAHRRCTDRHFHESSRSRIDNAAVAVAFIGVSCSLSCCAARSPPSRRRRPKLRSPSRRATVSGPPRHRFQDVLVSAQIAGALMLLVGAVLFARSFLRAQGEDPGYPAENLLIVRLDLPRAAYPEGSDISPGSSTTRASV